MARSRIASKSRWRLPTHPFSLLPVPRLPPESLAAVEHTVARLHCKMWYLARGIVPPATQLHPAVMQLIADWFDAVDEDGSRTLEHSELLAALKAAHIPCNDATITEMIKLMDINGDGVISWDEFRMFMADEFSNGKNLLTGEYILPSGATMNFGVVIGKLKRNKLMKDILGDASHRSKWVQVASDPKQLAREVATLNTAAQAAALINNALQAEMDAAHGEVMGDETKVYTPRTAAAQAFLGSVAHEARVARSLSRAASRARPSPHPGAGPAQHAALDGAELNPMRCRSPSSPTPPLQNACGVSGRLHQDRARSQSSCAHPRDRLQSVDGLSLGRCSIPAGLGGEGITRRECNPSGTYSTHQAAAFAQRAAASGESTNLHQAQLTHRATSAIWSSSQTAPLHSHPSIHAARHASDVPYFPEPHPNAQMPTPGGSSASTMPSAREAASPASSDGRVRRDNLSISSWTVTSADGAINSQTQPQQRSTCSPGPGALRFPSITNYSDGSAVKRAMFIERPAAQGSQVQ